MLPGGFGAQGRQQSQDCAFKVGTVCRAEIRMSYYVLIFFGYNLTELIKRSPRGSPGEELLMALLEAVGNEAILLATVLCHEFGHGNMARYLGGSIDHILLWVFGGICFSTRPQGHDNTKLLRNDLLIVAAGPCTHFVQAPAWGLLLWLIFMAVSSSSAGGFVGYATAWQAFLAALNPLVGLGTPWGMGQWTGLLWRLVGQGIQLNVALFIFNVFFPMYPADGAQLLVTSLMFFCGVPPRSAALVLICSSTVCAVLMIAWAVMGIIGTGNMLSGLMGWMGVMSLFETYNIWKLRKARLLHQHGLFKTARSWQRRERDAFGYVTRVNVGEFDDEAPLTRGGLFGELCRSMCRSDEESEGWSCAGCLTCLFPCLIRRPGAARRLPMPNVSPNPLVPAAGPAAAAAGPAAGDPEAVRRQRLQFLENVDRQQAERQRTVREYMDTRYGAGAAAQCSSAVPAAFPPPCAPGPAQEVVPCAAGPTGVTQMTMQEPMAEAGAPTNGNV